jgi:hypothetical protein
MVKSNLSHTQAATSDVNMTAVILLGLYEVNAPLVITKGKTAHHNSV